MLQCYAAIEFLNGTEKAEMVSGAAEGIIADLFKEFAADA